jgi:hypothetical protein
VAACAGLAAALWLPGTTEAGTKKGGTGKAGTGKQETTKAEKYQCATTVNFAKEYGMHYPSLATLGARIEQGRYDADPVCLAMCARECATCEKVSGKKAAITSGDLYKEAGYMAKYRYDPTELKAVAMLYGQGGKEYYAMATKAGEYQTAMMKARESGERTRGIRRQLHIDSRVPDAFITVYVNGRNVGTMPPMGDIYTIVGDSPWETTSMYARTNDGRFWSRQVRDDYDNFQWILR